MSRHLQTCKSRLSSIKTGTSALTGKDLGDVFLLKISAGRFYWLFIEVDGSAKLKDVDSFLRDIWVECCDHLSHFMIDGTYFESHPTPDLPSETMNVKLNTILRLGLKFGYEYDFGTTTHLTLQVISVRPGEIGKDKIRVISRNEPYTFECAICGKNATNICSRCIEETPDAFFCDDCLEKHECGEEMALPVVNSPRMGMCGYTG